MESLIIDGGLAAIMLAGLLAGLIHVFAGPDHLAAVAPLAAGAGRRAWTLGLRWGLGHAAGALLLGLAALLLRELLPLEHLSAWSERAVGLVLIGVGLWALRQAFRLRLHSHHHEHGGEVHEHVHLHDPDSAHTPERVEKGHAHGHAAFGVGLLHGAAGSHHLFGLMPALAMPSRVAAAGYLLCFALGGVLAMLLFSGLIGRLFVVFRGRGETLYRSLLVLTGSVALIVGIFWITL
jgi:ABC-type nickel/cobalt efflux system permease component RcnA